MTRWTLGLFLLAVLGLAVAVPAASACPMCKEAVVAPGDESSLTPEEQEGLQMARAYNNSIYLFVAMPYLLVGGVGFLVYRGYKNKLRQAQNAEQPTDLK
jgi:hypothetical protein